MADVSANPQSDDPQELVELGTKAYKLRDYDAAVTSLSRAAEVLASKHGDKSDLLGKVYLYYGKALLETSRAEAEPLGDGVACEISSDSEDESSSGNEETKTPKPAMNGSAETKVKPAEITKTDEAQEENNESEVSSANDQPSNSDGKKVADEDKPEDQPTDLQLAWEVLELAKLIYEEQKDNGKNELAEVFITLGEVSMESGNFENAIVDIKTGLKIQNEILNADSRNLAETYYKLAVALVHNNQFDDAVLNFNTSLSVLKLRIEKLKEKGDENKDEIKEIEALIPEIEEKIEDTKSCKEETAARIASLLKEKSTIPEASSSDKQPNDISHLVKRKRRLDDIVEECEAKNPNKKSNA